MKRIRKSLTGFTLIELVMVITVLGALAVIAIPQYFNLQLQAKTAGERGIVGGVRAGVMTQVANNAINNTSPIFPLALDAVDTTGGIVPCNTTNPCFLNVIPGGITEDWVKTQDASASYTGPETAGARVYTYSNTDGSFN